MLTESYVSFEIAQLLKEKGFDIPCRQAYFNGSLVDYTMYGFCDGELLDCPSQSLTLKWLREVHNIIIITYPVITDDDGECGCLWGYTIRKRLDSIRENDEVYYNPEKATEAALLYVLKNLI